MMIWAGWARVSELCCSRQVFTSDFMVSTICNSNLYLLMLLSPELIEPGLQVKADNYFFEKQTPLFQNYTTSMLYALNDRCISVS